MSGNKEAMLKGGSAGKPMETNDSVLRNKMSQEPQTNHIDRVTRQSSMTCINGGDLKFIGDSPNDDAIDPKTFWRCQHEDCGKKNPISVDQCIACLEFRSPAPDKPHPASESDEDDDEVHSIESDGDTVMEVDTAESWPCRRCTLINHPNSIRCEVCGAPKKDNIPKDVPGLPALPTAVGQSHEKSAEKRALQFPQRKLAMKRKRNFVKMSDLGSVDEISDDATAEEEEEDESIWGCNVCTYNNNPSSTDICDMCQSVKQVYASPERKPQQNLVKMASVEGVTETMWQCPKCKMSNTNSVRDCTSCGTLRFRTVVARDREETWTCSKCTLVNHSVAHVCAACRAKRFTVLPSIDETLPAARGWSCPTCTFINDDQQSVRCSACNHDKNKVCVKDAVNDVADGDEVVSRAGKVAKARVSVERQSSVRCEDQRLREESKARTQWIQIVNYCKENDEKFVDSDFPPLDKSLYYSGTARSDRSVTWMRPSDVDAYNHDRTPWTVLSKPVSSDICQGILGNCWFLSALAVIVERPALLEHIVVTRNYCSQGVYQIRLCKDGDWTTVIVDDLFPCDRFSRLIYSQTKRKQLWVPLIEKAFAKILGCYEALSSGRCIEGLATLTGAPCDSIQLSGSSKTEDDKDLIWAQLLSSRESGFLMGASCGGGNMKVDEKVYEQLGLIARHAYSILDVQTIEGHRLLRLRNPWGRFSFKGDWSDSSDLWQMISPAERLKYKPLGREEGVFWMSLDDLLRYFDVVDICKYRSDWMESRQKTILPSNVMSPVHATQIEIFEATEIEFGLFQEGNRGKERSKRNPVDLCICVYQCRGSDPSTVGGAVGPFVCCSKRYVQGCVGTSCFLEPGIYLVFTLGFNHWSTGSDASVNAVLTMHSSKAHLVQPVTLSKTSLADAVIQLALAKGEPHEGRQGMTTYYLARNWCGFIVVVENRNPDSALHVRCDCSGSINLVSTRCALKTVDAIPSLHRQVIIVLSQLERTSGYSLSHHLMHRCWSVGTGLGDWAPGANHVPALTTELYGLHAPRPI